MFDNDYPEFDDTTPAEYAEAAAFDAWAEALMLDAALDAPEPEPVS